MRTFKSQTWAFFTMHRSPEIFSTLPGRECKCQLCWLFTILHQASSLAEILRDVRLRADWPQNSRQVRESHVSNSWLSQTDNSLSSKNRLAVRASLLIERRLKVARFLLRQEKVEGQAAAFAHIHHYYCYCHYVSDLSGNLGGWTKECQKPTPKASESPQTPILMCPASQHQGSQVCLCE